MRRVLGWLLDAGMVLAFVVIGRASHHAGDSLAGLAETAWPFLTGLAIGELAAMSWHRPAAIAPAGVVVWLSTVGVGMTLRVIAGQGTAVAFIAVALAFLGLFLLGWRALAQFRVLAQVVRGSRRVGAVDLPSEPVAVEDRL